jgi:hypothetical protein
VQTAFIWVANKEFYVVYLGKDKNIKRIGIKELLPDGFTL